MCSLGSVLPGASRVFSTNALLPGGPRTAPRTSPWIEVTLVTLRPMSSSILNPCDCVALSRVCGVSVGGWCLTLTLGPLAPPKQSSAPPAPCGPACR